MDPNRYENTTLGSVPPPARELVDISVEQHVRDLEAPSLADLPRRDLTTVNESD